MTMAVSLQEGDWAAGNKSGRETSFSLYHLFNPLNHVNVLSIQK